MVIEKLEDIANVTAGTSPKGELINSDGIGLPFFQGSKEFGELVPRPERYTEHPVRTASEGDVLVGVRAPVGKVNLSPFDCAIGRGVMAVTPKNQSDGKFLFYFLRYLEGKWDSLGSTGSIFENLSASVLRSVEIPENLNRAKIGEVLYDLDLKIENNKLLAQNLESTAQRIFRSWFIDFDPVKAKMVGEAPVGMGAETAALFPGSMEDSKLGEIPAGWAVRDVESILVREKVRSLPKTTPLQVTGPTMVLEQGGNVFGGFCDQVPTVSASDEEPRFVFGDHTCQMRLVTVPFSVFPNVIVLRAVEANIYWAFLATSGLQKFETYRRHWSELAVKKVVLPPRPLTELFGHHISSFYALVDELERQNGLIASLRDALLPRLISGELEISDQLLAA